MKRLAVVCTHPIQYYAPIFRLITERGKIDVIVFYTQKKEETSFDKGFNQSVKWDIPLLDGYQYKFEPVINRLQSRNLIQAIENCNPDAVLVFGWHPFGHLSVMRYFKNKIPVWFRGDSTMLDEVPFIKKMLRKYFLTYVYKHIDIAFYVGMNNKNYFLAHGIPMKKLIFSPHAIENDRFSDNTEKSYEQKAQIWRNSLGISNNALTVLFAGKLEYKKAPDLLLNAVYRINQSLTTPVHLIFAGSGELEERLKKQAAKMPFIHFIGFQNQSLMPIVYRLGDIFCLPSRGPGETWGLAVNEAMASARPVVVSDKVGCGLDLVANQNFGRVFPVDDFSKMCDVLVDALQWKQPDTGKEASLFIQNWNFEQIAQKIEDELHS